MSGGPSTAAGSGHATLHGRLAAFAREAAFIACAACVVCFLAALLAGAFLYVLGPVLVALLLLGGLSQFFQLLARILSGGGG